MLIGGAVLGFQWLGKHKFMVINLMYFVIGTTFVLSGILPPTGFAIFAVITAFGGISAAVYSGSFTVVIQTMVEPSALGRVFSLYTSLTLMPSMLGLLATGFIADTIGIGNAFIISGAGICILGITAFIVAPLRALVREESRGGSAMAGT